MPLSGRRYYAVHRCERVRLPHHTSIPRLSRTGPRSQDRLAILDSATQIAAIPENNRPLVTRCLQALTRLCLDAKTTILLIGHNNRYRRLQRLLRLGKSRPLSPRYEARKAGTRTGPETIKLCPPQGQLRRARGRRRAPMAQTAPTAAPIPASKPTAIASIANVASARSIKPSFREVPSISSPNRSSLPPE